jgi:ribonuclease E
LWSSINTAAEKRSAPFLIYQESDIVIRTLRDYLREDTDSVIIDDLATFQNAKEFVSFVLPHHLDRIKQFDASEHSLFNHMGIESQVKSVFEREVSLCTGATIVFDPTEALTAIDINSARATKGFDIEETAYNTNLEAAKEIAAQLQLRDIGGLVVVDFIDMTSEEHKKSIEKAMEKATSSDRARIQIGTISRFGLLEMSRQRLMSSVTESVEKTCPACEGRGTTPTVPSLSLSILRQLEDGCNASQTQKLTIQSSVDVITYLLNEKRADIGRLEDKHEIKITLLPNPYMQFPNFNINKQKGDKKSHHKSYQGISKPQQNIAENGLSNTKEAAAINTNHPTTRVPNQKKTTFSLSFWGKIKSIFDSNKKKNKPNKKHNNKKNNRNRNKSRNKNNRNQNKTQNDQQNKQQNKQNNKQQNKPQNQNKTQRKSKNENAKPQAQSRGNPKEQTKPQTKSNNLTPKAQGQVKEKPQAKSEKQKVTKVAKKVKADAANKTELKVEIDGNKAE